MKHSVWLAAICIIATVTFANASAHTMDVVGQYKLEIGWKEEPPVEAIDNSIEIVITKATELDKKQAEEMRMKMEKTHDDEIGSHEKESMHERQEKTSHKDDNIKPGEPVPGLSSDITLTITLGDKSTKLDLEETKFAGVYHAKYPPQETGFPIVNINGNIHGTAVDIDMHPEKVDPLSTLPPLKQQKHNIDPHNVQCKEDLELYKRAFGSDAVCVTPNSAERLIAIGFLTVF